VVQIIPVKSASACLSQLLFFFSKNLRDGVSQGSVVGTILFLLHCGDHTDDHIESHGLCPHLYADDTQIYGSCRPSQQGGCARSLQLNSFTSHRLDQPSRTPLRDGADFVVIRLPYRCGPTSHDRCRPVFRSCVSFAQFAVQCACRLQIRDPVDGYVSFSSSSGLRKCDTCRHPPTPSSAAPVCYECSSSTRLLVV